MPDHIYRAEIITQYPHRFETLPVRIYDESGFVIGDITHMELGGIL